MTILNHSLGARPDLMAALSGWGSGGAITAPASATDLGQIPINLPGLTPGSVAQGFQPSFMDGMLGYRGADGTQFGGWGGMALGAANGILGAYTGFKNLGLFKDQLAQSKKQFEINFGAQQKLTNSRLEDRQAARVASNPTAYESVGSYMKKNGI